MDEYYINFDTRNNPGKLEAVKVAIGLETIADMARPLRLNLCDHPLYLELQEYVKANPR